MKVFVERIDSPMGQIFIAASEKGLVSVKFDASEEASSAECKPGGIAARAARALERYFAGDVRALEGLACDLSGTEFQRRVWKALREIPVGRTLSYAELARRVGRPTAARAVGAANGANPVALVVPCHRVIGASGALTGYAFGVERKRWLLAHEGAFAAATC
jgi:methylated-DNA-[protein]-cysteine S-methyltransferase